ncbi:MAG TPA: hypothetical protein VGQ92_09820 [Actinoplanes sp.]|nr:hypothetical protein [Actinoplanes sp.]
MSDDAGRTVAPDPLFQLGALLVAAPAADQEVMVRGGSLTRVLLRQETIEDRIRRASWHRRTESRAVTATIWPSALRVCSTAGCWPSTRCSTES